MRLPIYVRKLFIRGRRALRYFSAESWPTPPDEPQRSDSALRVQHYGFTSELPDDGQAIVLAVNGGENNLVSVAEISPDEPSIESGEVLIWAKGGQRLLLKANGDVVVMPKDGANVLLAVDSAGAGDKLVTEARMNAQLDKIRLHTHPVSGAVASAATWSGGLSVSGSPNVYAK